MGLREIERSLQGGKRKGREITNRTKGGKPADVAEMSHQTE